MPVDTEYAVTGHPKKILTARGFSLVELVIVVAIMAIIGAIAIPRMSRAGENAKDSALTTDIATLQHAIDLYRAEHLNQNPATNTSGTVDISSANFILRLTGNTAENNRIGSGGIFGPYLRKFPVNPINNLASVRINGVAAGANTHGWQFDTSTSLIYSDHTPSAKVDIVKPLGGLKLTL